MAHFWSKLQIPGILLSQNKQPEKLLRHITGSFDTVSLIKLRSFWFWGRNDKGKSEFKADCSQTESGKLIPERPKVSNPACSSKCLQIKNCDKEIVKQKLSNCREPEKIEKPISYWEIIFGWKTEDSPDPCICRRVHSQKQIDREQDPRLCDPRYKATPGDVLVFTETPRPKVCKPQEPQPQPPPPYKLPKAVLTLKITEQAKKAPYTCAAPLQFHSNCESSKFSGSMNSILPFEELRPPERQRKVFSCKYGIPPEDITGPMRRGCNSCFPSKSANSFNPEHYRERSAKLSIDRKPSELNSEEFSLHIIRKHSRIEQLKRQTRAKEGREYSTLLTSSFTKVSQCRLPCYRPFSYKMSTFAHR